MKKKTILFVPDFFWPKEQDLFAEITAAMDKMGIKLIVFPHEKNLEDSVCEIENYCRNNDIDLVISHLTGCYFIASLTSVPRLFVNPDWISLNEAYTSNQNKDKLRDYDVNDHELWIAQEMSRLDAIKRGKFSAKCLITADYLGETECIIEHLRRFHEVSYDPYISFPCGTSSLEYIIALMT